jgi:hypothetical protein
MRKPILLVVGLAAMPAAAQFTNPYNWSSWNNPVSSSIDLMISQRIERQVLERSLLKKYGKAPTAAAAPAPAPAPEQKPPPKQPLTATDFKPVGPKGKVAATFAASLEGLDATQKKQFETVFNDAVKAIEAEKDFRKNNLAYALALLLGASVQVTTGKEVSDADSQELARGLNDLLAAEDGFKKLSAKDRQTFYESCLVMGGLIIGLYTAGAESNDQALMEQAKGLGKTALERFGVKL